MLHRCLIRAVDNQQPELKMGRSRRRCWDKLNGLIKCAMINQLDEEELHLQPIYILESSVSWSEHQYYVFIMSTKQVGRLSCDPFAHKRSRVDWYERWCGTCPWVAEDLDVWIQNKNRKLFTNKGRFFLLILTLDKVLGEWNLDDLGIAGLWYWPFDQCWPFDRLVMTQ